MRSLPTLRWEPSTTSTSSGDARCQSSTACSGERGHHLALIAQHERHEIYRAGAAGEIREAERGRRGGTLPSACSSITVHSGTSPRFPLTWRSSGVSWSGGAASGSSGQPRRAPSSTLGQRRRESRRMRSYCGSLLRSAGGQRHALPIERLLDRGHLRVKGEAGLEDRAKNRAATTATGDRRGVLASIATRVTGATGGALAPVPGHELLAARSRRPRRWHWQTLPRARSPGASAPRA